MPVNTTQYEAIRNAAAAKGATLVAVSKTKPVSDILELYNLGHRDFGENYVQELVDKAPQLPADIRWHLIGHLQSNKVKYIAPFVHLVHGIDSVKLLREVAKQAQKAGRRMEVLLQVHVALEESKFGFDEAELAAAVEEIGTDSAAAIRQWVRVRGLMGMASFSTDGDLVRGEFRRLRTLYDQYQNHPSFHEPFDTLSMGMSGDYERALEEGSTMLRVGSLLFGSR